MVVLGLGRQPALLLAYHIQHEDFETDKAAQLVVGQTGDRAKNQIKVHVYNIRKVLPKGVTIASVTASARGWRAKVARSSRRYCCRNSPK
jgi:hypothetical protein